MVELDRSLLKQTVLGRSYLDELEQEVSRKAWEELATYSAGRLRWLRRLPGRVVARYSRLSHARIRRAILASNWAPRDATVGYANEFLNRFGYEGSISKFQEFQALRGTGRFDSSTITKMCMPRCGVPDLTTDDSGRSLWPDPDITYGFRNFDSNLSQADIEPAVRAAFNTWGLVTPLRFTLVSYYADIWLGFYTGDHGDGSINAFDGWGGVSAHASAPWQRDKGQVHFDGADRWNISGGIPGVSFDLESMALQEIGHALGMWPHSKIAGEVMAGGLVTGEIRRDLLPGDIQWIQSLYGGPTDPAKGSHDHERQSYPSGSHSHPNNLFISGSRHSHGPMGKNGDYFDGSHDHDHRAGGGAHVHSGYRRGEHEHGDWVHGPR